MPAALSALQWLLVSEGHKRITDTLANNNNRCHLTLQVLHLLYVLDLLVSVRVPTAWL